MALDPTGSICIRYADGTKQCHEVPNTGFFYRPAGENRFYVTFEVNESNPFRLLKEENESLRRRLQHLLESEYIRSFDEINPRTHTYKRDIREADAGGLRPFASYLAAERLRRIAKLAEAAAEKVEKGE